MDMMISHIRCQRAVGHGFFHTAQVSVATKVFRYIYDCGGSGIRNRISEYLEDVGENYSVDALFISHLHADHISGLDSLLARIKVNAVILPYLSFEERLLLTMESLGTSKASSTFWECLRDPVKWFSARGVERVIEVRGADPDLPIGLEAPPPVLPEFGNLIENHGTVSDWGIQMKIGAAPNLGGSGGDSSINQSRNGKHSRISHDSPFILLHQRAFWLFLTFVQSAPTLPLSKFYSDVLKSLTKDERKLIYKSRSSEVWTNILSNASLRRGLKRAYARIFPDFNRTSLCLYSGRGPSSAKSCTVHSPCSEDTSIHASFHAPHLHAWLGVGDANLLDDDVRSEFLRHYGELLPTVFTMGLPHHGSERNFHRDLLAPLYARRIFATSRSISRHHPSPSVVRDILFARVPFIVVSERDETEFWESVEIL